MRSAFRVVCILAPAVILVFALCALQSRSPARSARPPLKETMRSALTNPVEFAKSRFTGGIGVMVTIDPASNLPSIGGVAANSPADRAGLRAGDLISKVNGLATTGRPLTQVVESIRGFSGGSVALTVQRNGSTNLECVIQRSSWNGLRGLSYNPYE